jgi:tripeptidyl-peptidase-1
MDPTIPACNAYHLPTYIAPHVDLVTPTVHFNAILNKRSTTEPARKVGQPGFGTGPTTTGIVSELLQGTARCDEQINPDCLRALYKLFYEPVAGDKNSYAIGLFSSLLIYIRSIILTSYLQVEYTPQAYLQPDLNDFFTEFSLLQLDTSPDLISIDGGRSLLFPLSNVI